MIGIPGVAVEFVLDNPALVTAVAFMVATIWKFIQLARG